MLDATQTKLDDKNQSCVFLGVGEVSKSYKLFHPISKIIIINREVVFDENKSWDWDKQHVVAITCDLEFGDKKYVINDEKHEVENTMPDATQQHAPDIA